MRAIKSTAQVMRKLLLCIPPLLVLVTAPTAIAGGSLDLVSFSGFDYETDGAGGADPTPDSLLAVGDGYEMLGVVHSFGDGLEPLADFGTHQYTFVISGLTVVDRRAFAQFLSVFTTPGRIDVYQDPLGGGTAANYGESPPNAAPATFTDGELILSAPINNFNLVFNQNNQQGSWQCEAEADAGLWLAAVPSPGGACTLDSGAQIGGASVPVPSGYGYVVNGVYALICGSPVRHATWGELKSLYR